MPPVGQNPVNPAHSRGFAILEVIIAIGLISLLGLALAYSVEFYQRSSMGVQQSIDFGLLKQHIGLVLGNPELCRSMLEGKSFDKTAVFPQEIDELKVGGTLLARPGEPAKGLRVFRLRFESAGQFLGSVVTDFGAGPLVYDRYYSSIHLEADKVIGGMPVLEANRMKYDFPVLLHINPSKKIGACDAMPSSLHIEADWQAWNADHVNFNPCQAGWVQTRLTDGDLEGAPDSSIQEKTIANQPSPGQFCLRVENEKGMVPPGTTLEANWAVACNAATGWRDTEIEDCDSTRHDVNKEDANCMTGSPRTRLCLRLTTVGIVPPPQLALEWRRNCQIGWADSRLVDGDRGDGTSLEEWTANEVGIAGRLCLKIQQN